jgi:hypothetical protein
MDVRQLVGRPVDGHLALGRVSSKLIPEPGSARLALLASYAD